MNIDTEIAGYTARCGASTATQAPYDSASLGVIYGERVQQLVDLKAQGFTVAEWKYDAVQRVNRWHGVPTSEQAERDYIENHV
jgi:hypothetical protein